MEITIDSMLRLRHADLPHGFKCAIHEAFRFPNPRYQRLLRMGKPTYSVPEYIYLYRRDPHDIILPRGTLKTVCNMLDDINDDYTIVDRRVMSNHASTGCQYHHADEGLRDYQRAAGDAFIDATQGVIVMPCGAGKTRTALGIVSALGVPALVLVHRRDLLEQWREAIRKVFDIPIDAIGGGCRRDSSRPISVAMIQTLSRWDDDVIADLMRDHSLLIVDECHHIPATTFSRLVSFSPARYRMGLSATPERADGLTPVLHAHMGPEVYRITHDGLDDAGVLCLPEIVMIHTAFRYDYADDYADMMRALIVDSERNALITREVVALASLGHRILVLTDRVEHCHVLGRRLAEAMATPGCVDVLTGSVTRARRTEILAAVRTGTTTILVATSLADEGLDLPSLSCVVLAYPGRNAARTIQRIGRIMRPSGDLSPVVVDVVDPNVGVLKNQSWSRQRAYRHMTRGRGERYDDPSTS